MMKKIYLIALTGLLTTACQLKEEQSQQHEPKVELNQDLANELETMAEIDQVAAFMPQGKYKELSKDQWQAFQDSVFTSHQTRLAEIFEEYGFPGYDLVGKDGSRNFWLIVQHSDHNPGFQQEVLEKMKVEVEKENAEPANYGLLVDRVQINTGKPQVYGTQVTYNTDICQAYPKELADADNVNDRRESIGLPPIEEYLNKMTQMHFDMNKERYISKGITEPKLYNTEAAVSQSNLNQ